MAEDIGLVITRADRRAGAGLCLLILAANLLGDGFRNALDERR